MRNLLYDAGFPALRRFRIPPAAPRVPGRVSRVQANFSIQIEED